MKKAGRKGFKKADTAALWHGKGLDPPTDEQHTRLKEINTSLSYLQLFVVRSHYGRCFWAVFVSLCLFFFSLTLCLSRLAKFLWLYFPYNLGSVFGYFAPLSHFVSTFYHIVILFHLLLTIGISWPLFCISVVIFAYLL